MDPRNGAPIGYSKPHVYPMLGSPSLSSSSMLVDDPPFLEGTKEPKEAPSRDPPVLKMDIRTADASRGFHVSSCGSTHVVSPALSNLLYPILILYPLPSTTAFFCPPPTILPLVALYWQ